MLHLGDITKIHGGEAPVVDVVIGGSPCQDLSIAGKRAGLAGARSGLYMEQIRIIKEMRARDMASGRTGEFVRPRYMVWENVPGAFSSNGGKDFAAVLEEAIRIAEPEAPDIEVPEKGWNTWGGYHDEMGGRWSVAWRVLDAQHWGVPQRRRRIALVADFGGDTAWEISFEQQSMSGDLAESGATGEGPAGDSENGVDSAKQCLTAWDCQSKRIFDPEGQSPALQGGVGGGVNNPAIFCMATQQGGAEIRNDDRAPTLTAAAGMSGNNQPCIAIPINDKATRCSGGGPTRNHDGAGNGLGIGKDGDPSPTLTAGDRHGVCAVLDMSHACDVIRDCGEVVPALQARMGTGGNQVPLTYQMQGFGDYREGDVASSCKQRDFKDGTDLVCAVDCRNFREGGEINGTLQAKESEGQSLNLNNTVRQNMVVRRLTPLECERLQGFPDHWTDLGEWTDSKGKRHKDADSPRYKALGNSIALPPWKWLLKRLCGNYERDATMASLFDGIGGFPLIWEQLNGRGTCLWASEIEEFPIAVTKRRFGTVEEPGDMGRFLFPCGNERSGT